MHAQPLKIPDKGDFGSDTADSTADMDVGNATTSAASSDIPDKTDANSVCFNFVLVWRRRHAGISRLYRSVT